MMGSASERIILPNEVLLNEVTALLAEGHSVTLPAKGNSMLPFIRGGQDNVVLQLPEQIQEGDIVLVRHATFGYLLHRILHIDGEQITLMGDGNCKGVENCNRASLFGKVTAIIRNGKTIDCYSPGEQRKARLWIRLLPFRRILLAIYKRLCL